MTDPTPRQELSHALTQLALDDAQAKLAAIETLCLRHNNPAVITSTHWLASKVLLIIHGRDAGK